MSSITKFTITGLAAIMVLLVFANTGFGQQTISWSDHAVSLRGRNGQQFAFVCPANGSISGRLWGSVTYTDDSSICSAAVHAGLISVQSGGVVRIQIAAGLSSYQASTRNGVTSRPYGSWAGSYVFVGKGAVSTPPPSNATSATWSTRADSLRGRNGQRFRFVCPGGGLVGSVWGTDVYTDDSSICSAAVHAGLIGTASGGLVTIEIRPGITAYQASTRNGVSTNRWGSWHGSFVFVR